jgi:hypothetical protein
LVVAAATVLAYSMAAAHGIAGNRLFPGTLSFDDLAVADEFACGAARTIENTRLR